MGTQRLQVETKDTVSTVEVLATKTEKGYRIAAYNHNIPDAPIKAEEVSINVSALANVKEATIYRIDENHGNAKALWVEMGAPQYLKPQEVIQLKEASTLKAEKISYDDFIKFTLSPYGIVFIDILGK